ncbi:uroporphyrinogen-III synthase [Roseibium aggregatum]|uniref:Uroporphyrinogen-III synthase n=1 Tax=Roseibium aggregatum TaxID=187304 RepID=A0A939J758_9HYPH|nr:uroporphyrinogen-III synthase [Roseibium aggregatum]MBN9673995.1 uroporphyrinogen-III synthase [Roseibium aggregatum]
MRFLVTRPQPDCKRTADKLRAFGHIADEAPLLHFLPEAPEHFDLTGVAALAFSSRRAVSVVADHVQMPEVAGLPVFTVGQATASACRLAGFADVRTGEGDVAALGALISSRREDLASGAVLYPAARERAGDLEGILTKGGIACRTVVVYRMAPSTGLDGDLIARLNTSGYRGILIYSKRTAQTLADLLRSHRLEHIFSSVSIYAISRQAAEPLSGFKDVRIAATPNESAVLDLVLAEC